MTHTHACVGCDIEVDPTGEGTFGVQPPFNQVWPGPDGNPVHVHDLRPVLDGEPVEYSFACRVGADGWVLRYQVDKNGRSHRCSCGEEHGCAEQLHGRVELRKADPADT